MSLDDNLTKIIIAVLALITVILGGLFVSKKITHKSKSENTTSDISIKGNDNKVVGGDDNSSS